MKTLFISLSSTLLLASAGASAETRAREIIQHGIAWKFAGEVMSGQFCNGDYWVVGPVNVIGITTDLHGAGFTPKPGEDGSMVNPGTGGKQGYDSRISSYDENLNAALPHGKPLSPSNPLSLTAGSSLVSMVSWLYNSPDDAEPGIPNFNAGTKAPRPVTRSAAVLTVLQEPPPQDSFRPSYAGSDKAIKHKLSQLDRTRLKNLDPVEGAPDPGVLAGKIRRPWIDHVHEYLGAMVHPSENMPGYGRDMAAVINDVALVLHLDFSKIPGDHNKDELLIPFIQMGIDFAGIADSGGGWPANGGHHMGRKLPILFAGGLLNDEHMKNVGHRTTRFQEDEQTFVVTQEAVDITNGSKWAPDRRGGAPEPYTTEDIGLAEWGIRHSVKPEADNKEWAAPYRANNNASIPGFALNARLLGLEDAWNHPALFAYADRIMEKGTFGAEPNGPSPFLIGMWKTYGTKP